MTATLRSCSSGVQLRTIITVRVDGRTSGKQRPRSTTAARGTRAATHRTNRTRPSWGGSTTLVIDASARTVCRLDVHAEAGGVPSTYTIEAAYDLDVTDRLHIHPKPNASVNLTVASADGVVTAGRIWHEGDGSITVTSGGDLITN